MNLILMRAAAMPLCLPAPPVVETPRAVVDGFTLDRVSEYAHGVASRTTARLGYEVTGFVLTQKTRGAKCIVDGKDAAWMPGEEARKLLKWEKPKQAKPPEGFEPPPDAADDGERAMQSLAMRLGLGFNSSIPHNTGWFVPGFADAFATPDAAIEALFELIYTAPDATVYRPGKSGRAAGMTVEITGTVITTGTVPTADEISPATPAPKVKAAPPAAEIQTAQESLF